MKALYDVFILTPIAFYHNHALQPYQASHFSGDTKFHVFSGYFQVNAMKSQDNLALNQCLC